MSPWISRGNAKPAIAVTSDQILVNDQQVVAGALEQGYISNERQTQQINRQDIHPELSHKHMKGCEISYRIKQESAYQMHNS